MKKKMIAAILLVVLLAQMAPVFATQTGTPGAGFCSGYWADGVLHTFVRIYDPQEEQSVKLLVDNMKMGEQIPQTLADAGMTAHVMLLVDISSSMDAHREKVVSLARELMEAEQNLKISIAWFDHRFEVAATELTEWSDVRATLYGLGYSNGGSDICGAVSKALDALGREGYAPEGEMTSLVVITDGASWYSDDAEQQQQALAAACEGVVAMRECYTEIVVHTYSVTAWADDALQALSDDRGIHMVGSGTEMGKQLAAYMDEVRVASFPLSGDREAPVLAGSVRLMVDRTMLSCGTIRNTGVAPDVVTETEPVEPTEPVETTEPAESTEPAETTEPTEPVETTEPVGTTEPVETTEPAETTEPVETSEPVETTLSTETNGEAGETTVPGTTAGDPGTDDDCKNPLLWMILGGAVIVVLILLVLLLSKARAPKNAIRMKIELVAGNGVRLKDVYYLSRELLIGSDGSCQIRIPGRNGVNARIYLQNQMIYVEDLGLPEGTLLNGMRMFSPNRLRSGDQITIGAVTLRVLF